MPELPEVETVKRGLRRLIVGRRVIDVDFNWPKGFQASDYDIDNYLIDAKVTDVKRRAKALKIELDSDYTLVVHLKMTGQLVFRGDENFGAGHPTDSLIGELPDKSTRVIFTFEDGSKLFFNDQRKFGWIKLLPTKKVNELEFFKKVGPEPLGKGLTPKDFVARFRRRNKTPIKAALLDQSVVAGVGNIYADEALFVAKIHPETKVEKVSDNKLKELYKAVREVLSIGIDTGGSTDRNYVDVEGNKGSYLEFAQVFRREGKKCLRCGNEIEKIKVAGRGTHICPKCQRKKRDIHRLAPGDY